MRLDCERILRNLKKTKSSLFSYNSSSFPSLITCLEQPFVTMTTVSEFFVAFHWLLLANSAVNPVLYGIVNPFFRRAYLKLLQHIKTTLWYEWRCNSLGNNRGDFVTNSLGTIKFGNSCVSHSVPKLVFFPRFAN